MKKPVLGRGLEALLGDAQGVLHPSLNASNLRYLPVEHLKSGPYQPRKDFDNGRLQELADSIRAQGVVQPIVVRAVDGHYQIIAGERRWRASQMAGLREVPVVIRDVDDQAVLAIALIENIQRQDLNPVEEAEALRRLQQEFSMTHQQIADIVGKSRATVTNLLRLNDLDDEVKILIRNKALDMGHARAMLTLPAEKQRVLAQQVIDSQLNVRQTEALVQRLDATAENTLKKPGKKITSDPEVERLEERLSERLAAEVKISYGKSGHGTVVIRYSSLDQLQGILERMGEESEAV